MTMYHVSKIDLGETFVFAPKHPHSAPPQENKKARVCFSPSLRQCLLAINSGHRCSNADAVEDFLPRRWKENIANPVIYTTRKKLVKAPHHISDFAHTQEHWSFESICLKRKGYIDLKKFMIQTNRKRIPITNEPFLKLSKAEFVMWKSALKQSRQSILIA
jgi:hypothetical protein